jgi:hypothetical protein
MKFPRYLLLLPLAAFVPPNTWQPFAIDKQVAVLVPTRPSEADIDKLAKAHRYSPTRVWTTKAPEGTYFIIRTAGKTSESIGRQNSAQRQALYTSIIQAALQSDKGKLLTRISFPTAGGPGCEVKYRGTHPLTQRRVVKYLRYLVVDSIGYSFQFLPANPNDSLGLAGAEQRHRFFNSITVKP